MTSLTEETLTRLNAEVAIPADPQSLLSLLRQILEEAA